MHRNLKVWNDVTEVCATVVGCAKTMVEDWLLANASRPAVPGNQQHAQLPHGAVNTAEANATAGGSVHAVFVSCQRPLPGRYKCNIDAAFSSSLNCTGIGICVRDSEGIFVLVKAVSFPCVYSVDVGEALGLHNAL